MLINGRKYCLRQIKIQSILFYKIKRYCHYHKENLKDFYKKMLTWFITNYRNKPNLFYKASYKNGHILTLWLEEEQVANIHEMAVVAGVSDARVIYTAMILYIEYLGDIL